MQQERESLAPRMSALVEENGVLRKDREALMRENNDLRHLVEEWSEKYTQLLNEGNFRSELSDRRLAATIVLSSSDNESLDGATHEEKFALSDGEHEKHAGGHSFDVSESDELQPSFDVSSDDG